MQPWICVAATSADGEIAVWNGETGVGMPSLKGNASGPNCLVPCGTDYLLVAQCNKPAINVWSWPKDQVLHRCFIAESMRAVACTACGTYVAGGGASGTLYLWNAASGALLTSLPSHFKAITALCFDDGGSVVVSGGEDTLVQAFLLPDLLSPACHRAQNAAPSPLHSWSVHTLAVTALCCGAGLLNPILLTASMDRSCHIFSLATGAELKAVHLPASLHSLALDAGEHAAYVGGNDGRIFEISLVGCPRDGREGDARAAAAAVSPGGSSQQLPEEVTALEGHSGCVHSLSLSPAGDYLVSGSADGSVRIWEARSRQLVRVLQPSSKGGVTGVLALQWPPLLSSAAVWGLSRTPSPHGTKAGRRQQPFVPLAKFMQSSGSSPAQAVPLVLDGSLPYRGIVPSTGLLGPGRPSASRQLGGGDVDDVMEYDTMVGSMDSTSGGADLVASLNAQLADALAAADKWRRLHAELHAFCVEHVLPPDALADAGG